MLVIHHGGEVRLHRVAAIGDSIDAGCHAVSATGVDEDNAVSTLGTIDGSSVFENGNLLNIVYVNTGEDIVEEAVVNGCVTILQILHHTVKNDERLGGGVERIDTLNHH